MFQLRLRFSSFRQGGRRMKVWVNVGEDSRAYLGNNGIMLHIADNNGKHVGRLRIGQATLEWCPGKVQI